MVSRGIWKMEKFRNLAHLPVPTMKQVNRQNVNVVGPQSALEMSEEFDVSDPKSSLGQLIAKYGLEMERRIAEQGYVGALPSHLLKYMDAELKELDALQKQLQRRDEFDMDEHLLKMPVFDEEFASNAIWTGIHRWNQENGPVVCALKEKYGHNPFLSKERRAQAAHDTLEEINQAIRSHYQQWLHEQDPYGTVTSRLEWLHKKLCNAAIAHEHIDEMAASEADFSSSGSTVFDQASDENL